MERIAERLSRCSTLQARLPTTASAISREKHRRRSISQATIIQYSEPTTLEHTTMGDMARPHGGNADSITDIVATIPRSEHCGVRQWIHERDEASDSQTRRKRRTSVDPAEPDGQW